VDLAVTLLKEGSRSVGLPKQAAAGVRSLLALGFPEPPRSSSMEVSRLDEAALEGLRGTALQRYDLQSHWYRYRLDEEALEALREAVLQRYGPQCRWYRY
jgi:hypothetical protein